MNRFHRAARLDELPLGRGKLVLVAGIPVALFRLEEGLFALDNRCPHAGAPLSRGQVCQGVVTCPLHHWHFRLADGQHLDQPASGRHAICYPVCLVGDEVHVSVPDSDPLAEPEERDLTSP
jgi:nitrite reductase/ring-hydroxylating ferredoxin subunit